MEFLKKLFVAIIAIVAVALVIFVAWGVFGVLEQILIIVPASTVIVVGLFLAGMNVLAYFASYVWGGRKKWYFWVCLALTILFCTLPLWANV